MKRVPYITAATSSSCSSSCTPISSPIWAFRWSTQRWACWAGIGGCAEANAAQAALEDRPARTANRLLVRDSDPLATTIWHERYLGRPAPEVETIAATRQCALYLVTDVDIPFVQDGTRDGENIRSWMHDRFVEVLTAQGRRFAVVSGDRRARLARAIQLIDPLLGGTPLQKPDQV